MKNSALLTEYGFTLDPDGDPDTVAALEPEVGVIEIPTLGGKRFDLLRSLNLVGAPPLALSPLPLVFSYKSEKSLYGKARKATARRPPRALKSAPARRQCWRTRPRA